MIVRKCILLVRQINLLRLSDSGKTWRNFRHAPPPAGQFFFARIGPQGVDKLDAATATTTSKYRFFDRCVHILRWILVQFGALFDIHLLHNQQKIAHIGPFGAEPSAVA